MPTILVLDDDEDRAAMMMKVLAERFDHFKHVFFDNAPETIAWLKANLKDVVETLTQHCN